jgi:hypothetical protein
VRRAFLAGALAAIALQMSAAEPDAEIRDIPAEYVPAVNAAIDVGTQLFVHDVSAARASDELVRRKIYEKDKRIRGWITDVDSERSSIIVTFVGDVEGSPRGLHRVTVPMEGVIEYEALKPAKPLEESAAARWKSRMLAIADLAKRDDLCSSQYNTVVLPAEPARGEVIRVYMLAATSKPGVIVAGGHFRYEYSVDGEHLESVRAFTKSCIEIPGPESDQGKPAGIMLTHMLDPTPTEIHVFLGRLHAQPVFLGTEAGIWAVQGREIYFVEPREK